MCKSTLGTILYDNNQQKELLFKSVQLFYLVFTFFIVFFLGLSLFIIQWQQVGSRSLQVMNMIDCISVA